jgi:hypothetical protein
VISVPGERGPGLGYGSHIEAQIGIQFSALGSIVGFPACVEDAQRLRLPSAPLSPPGAYRFAPDPISEKGKNPAIEIKFPLHLSLDCLDVRGQAQRALA